MGITSSERLASELLLDLGGLSPALLCDPERLVGLARALVELLGVHALDAPQLKQFPATERGPGGVTLLLLLSESHLALHSWPEHGALLVSVCCCRPLPSDAALASLLNTLLGPHRARVTRVHRELP